jgi:hypothetical protein
LELHGEITAADRAGWIPASIDTASVIGWADESFQIAVKPETGYCVKKDGECWYTPEQREYVAERPLRKAVVDKPLSCMFAVSTYGPDLRLRIKEDLGFVVVTKERR